MHTYIHMFYIQTQYIALTGHQTMLRPARKNPPTVPRLVEYIAWKKRKKERKIESYFKYDREALDGLGANS